MLTLCEGERQGVMAREDLAARLREWAKAHPDAKLFGEAADVLDIQARTLGEIYKETGADTDGNEAWRNAPYAFEEVRRLRAEYDAQAAQIAALTQERNAAEQEATTCQEDDLFHAHREVATLRARVAVLTSALSKLRAEVGGMLGTIEPELREAMGNSNTTTLRLRYDEANDALASPQTETPDGKV
ncbi:MAG: hypothetical protein WC655_17235 [Candidatus Hydrogenedentales bacterium]